MPRRTVLLDTSFIVALENGDDPYHERAKLLDRSLLDEGAFLLLHWGILLEIGDGYARIRRRSKGSELLEKLCNEEEYQIVHVSDTQFAEAMGLYSSRPDKEWGLTDCVSFTVMRHQSVSEALTADHHFEQAGFTALLLDDAKT